MNLITKAIVDLLAASIAQDTIITARKLLSRLIDDDACYSSYGFYRERWNAVMLQQHHCRIGSGINIYGNYLVDAITWHTLLTRTVLRIYDLGDSATWFGEERSVDGYLNLHHIYHSDAAGAERCYVFNTC